MSALKKYEKPALIGVAIFCLVIFSVTPQMTSVFAGILGNGPQPMATIEIGGEKKVIDLEAYRQARNLYSLARTFSGGPQTGGERSEDVVTFAAMRMLADEFQLEATDAMLLDQLRPLIQQLGSQEQYARFYKSMGYSTARSFENVLREVLRVNLMKSLLATSTIPTTEDVLDLWARNNEEMRLQFAVWRADEFVDAAAKAEPREEELKAFFENGLTPAQKHDLEKEETVTFDAVLLTPEAMQTEAVKKWADTEEPAEESIQGFYNFHRFDLYRRPLPKEGEEIDPSKGVFFDLEEIHDQVVRDFRMDKAAQLLRNELAESEEPAALAKERGAEFKSFSKPIPRSEIEKLPRIGSPRLQVLFQGEVGTWTAQTLFKDGVAFLARPTAKTDRVLPPLEEVRASVVDLWREKKQGELAQEAAQAFLDGLPRPEGYVEGDPVVLDAEAFAAAVDAVGKKLQVLDWIGRNPRPAVDPRWGKDQGLLRWLRSTVGRTLGDDLEGQALDPLVYPIDRSFVVVRLDGRRPPDKSKIWPNELRNARQQAFAEKLRVFQEEKLSFTGLAQAYNLELAKAEDDGS